MRKELKDTDVHSKPGKILDTQIVFFSISLSEQIISEDTKGCVKLLGTSRKQSFGMYSKLNSPVKDHDGWKES